MWHTKLVVYSKLPATGRKTKQADRTEQDRTGQTAGRETEVKQHILPVVDGAAASLWLINIAICGSPAVSATEKWNDSKSTVKEEKERERNTRNTSSNSILVEAQQ